MGEAPEKITIAAAIEFFRGEVWSAETWLERHRDGPRKDRRGELDIMQHEKKLAYRRWVVAQLEKSQRKD